VRCRRWLVLLQFERVQPEPRVREQRWAHGLRVPDDFVPVAATSTFQPTAAAHATALTGALAAAAAIASSGATSTAATTVLRL